MIDSDLWGVVLTFTPLSLGSLLRSGVIDSCDISRSVTNNFCKNYDFDRDLLSVAVPKKYGWKILNLLRKKVLRCTDKQYVELVRFGLVNVTPSSRNFIRCFNNPRYCKKLIRALDSNGQKTYRYVIKTRTVIINGIAIRIQGVSMHAQRTWR